MNVHWLVKEAHRMAKEKGWWPWPQDSTAPIAVAAKLALVHSEVSEALECVRDGQMDLYTIEGKPIGLPSELADIVIRVADLCGALGIDLEAAIETKLAYNATRTHRHGGRLL